VIVLDTNVLSEPLRAAPSEIVVAWMGSQTDVAVTAVSVAELLVGARRLPAGARRERLITDVEVILSGARVLSFDERAARVYARMQEARRAAGHALSVEDGMIAAIAAVHHAALATRNTTDFEGLDLDLINPWTQG
jgi:predicted nucleic acid-binding protein